MKRRSRDINVFSVSALDLFASALGAFILISIIFMVFFTKTSTDDGALAEAQAAVEECNTERALVQGRLVWCRGQLAPHPAAEAALAECQAGMSACESALDQCGDDLAAARSRSAELESQAAESGGASEQLARADAELAACRDALRKTFALVIMSWSTRDDVDLHVVDPQGREFFFNNKRMPGTPAALEEDNIQGPGNEVWLHPSATPGRYRICYKLYSHRTRRPLPVRGSVLWQDGKRALPLTTLSRRGQALLVAEIVARSDGGIAVDASRSGMPMRGGRCG